ncbi:hypothetical protein H9L39_19483 [Fusarium oxysporum f. sp. albedinis]|nr:hypothetical protein H9L39_19483 [Fusarium oxysporum f. sp. albedinis]
MGLGVFEFVEKWLEQIPQPKVPAIETERSAKRRKLDSTTFSLPSPERSVASSDPGQDRQYSAPRMNPETPLKRKSVDQTVDNDDTPRPNKVSSTPTGSSIMRDAPSMSASDTSQRSGRSSPSRTFPFTGIDGHYLNSMTLDPNHDGFPSGLEELLQNMDDIMGKRDIVPEYLKSEIEKPTQTDKTLRRLRSYAYTSSSDFGLDSDDLIPANRFLSTVISLSKFAGQCQDDSYDETGWNHLVHTPILQTVFRGGQWPGNALIDFAPCMNASVVTAYHRFFTAPSKVDYALYINPKFDSDDGVNEAIEKLYKSPFGSVNHTAFGPLSKYPSSLSIETKRYGGDLRRADVQTAAWHAAQWTYLRSQAGDAVDELPFLPGIIVQGHEWKFVATTRKNNETVRKASLQELYRLEN